METKNSKLGPLELRVLSWTQLKKLSLVRTQELSKPLSLSLKQLKEVMSRLSRAGIVVRISRGVYLIPERLPPGGQWGPNRLWVLDQFMRLAGATYQVTGLEAFNQYGLSTQIPNVLTVYNTRVSGRRTFGNASFDLIRVAESRLGGTELRPIPEGGETPFPTLARALFDAVYDWSRFNLFLEALERIVKESAKDPAFRRDLIRLVVQYGNIGTVRRMGYILEKRAKVSPRILEVLAREVPKNKSKIPLVPGARAKGPGDVKWGIIVNDN